MGSWRGKRGEGSLKGWEAGELREIIFIMQLTMLNTMCFAIKKGVLTEEAKIRREEARDARYGRQEVWNSPPPPAPAFPKNNPSINQLVT